MKGTLVLNFKTYKEATGNNAIKLAKISKQIAQNYNVKILIAPQYADMKEIVKLKTPVVSQHIDPIEPDKHTGYVSPFSIKEIGAIGTFLNHSERKLTFRKLKKSIGLAKKYKLQTFCFVASEKEAAKIAHLSPTYILYEPPELVGKGLSVSKMKPKGIKRTVEIVKKINNKIKVLCGAGIGTAEDVKIALQLGTDGVAVSSAFVKSKNPRKVLKNLVQYLR